MAWRMTVSRFLAPEGEPRVSFIIGRCNFVFTTD